MSYKIRVDYETGDSFGNESVSEKLDHVWKDVDIAKENLKRIKEHYQWYKSKHSRYSKKEGKKPKFECDEYFLYILLDDRSETRICASWCGYFERLYGASIVADEEDGWSFSL